MFYLIILPELLELHTLTRANCSSTLLCSYVTISSITMHIIVRNFINIVGTTKLARCSLEIYMTSHVCLFVARRQLVAGGPSYRLVQASAASGHDLINHPSLPMLQFSSLFGLISMSLPPPLFDHFHYACKSVLHNY